MSVPPQTESTSGFYRAFEERYYAPRDVIKTLRRQYLPFVEPLISYYPNGNVFDIGCGRGEWLELMKEIGFAPYGVDLDEGMLNDCRALNLPSELGDAVPFLKKLKNDSQVVVSAFHVVEHIKFEQLQTVVREALRVLKPGGLLVMETPNPENIGVATRNFYLDPTHYRPIPPLLLSFLAEYYGYKRVKTLRLQESPDLRTRDDISLFNVLEGVSPDYAVVAQKDATVQLLQLLDEKFNQVYGIELQELAKRYDARFDHRISALNQQLANLEAHGTGMVDALSRISILQDRLIEATTQFERSQSHATQLAEKLHHSEQLAQEQEQRAVAAESRAQEQEQRAVAAESRAQEQEQRAVAAESRAQEQEQREIAAEMRAKEEEQRASNAEVLVAEFQQRIGDMESRAQEQEQRAQHVEALAKQHEQRANHAEAQLQEMSGRIERALAVATQGIEAVYLPSKSTMNSPPMQKPDFKLPIPINFFLDFHDEDFIYHAYQYILGRNPDSNGLPHYLSLLRQGESKIEILGRLRYSREGRQYKVKISGLLLAFGLQRAYNFPLLGRLLHIMSCIYHLPDIERAQRSFEDFTVRKFREISVKQQNLNSVLVNTLRQDAICPDTSNSYFNGSFDESIQQSDQRLTPAARRILSDLRGIIAKR